MKIGGSRSSRIPVLAKHPKQEMQSPESHDVEMEGIETALAEKLVLPIGLRRKRSDSMFGMIEELPIKRVKMPKADDVDLEEMHAFSETLTILVKDEEHKNRKIPLQISKEVACKSSGYFSAAVMLEFVSNWKSAFPSPIDLSDEDPSVVRHYLQWLEIGKITTHERPRWASEEEKEQPNYHEEMSLDTEQLAYCYGLGERMKDASYRNAIIQSITDYVVEANLFPSNLTIATIYKSTKKGSPARKMMVDFWAYSGSEEWLESESIIEDVCLEFFEDLVPALLRVRARPKENMWPWLKSTNAYFINDDSTQPEKAETYKQDSMEMQE